MTAVTPPSLSYFCIFNPTFCVDDATLATQIFFYTSRAESVSQDEKLRKIGLIQGIISFASDFSNRKPVEIIDTRKTRTVIVEIEQNWWIVFCVNFTRIQTTVTKTNINDTRNKDSLRGGALASFRRRQTELKTEYSRKEVPGYSVMHSQIIRGYNQWKLLYGRLPLASEPEIQEKDSQEKKSKINGSEESENEDESGEREENVGHKQLRADLSKFWSWWLHKWELYMFSSATWGGTINNSFLAHGLVLGSLPTLSFSFMDYANGIKSTQRISDLTAEAIRSIVKKEAKNGHAGHSESAESISDAASIRSGRSTRDDAASIRSARSAKIIEPEIDESDGQDEYKNGCVFQGVGYISRSSVAEYSRWVIDNHIYPSPSTVEGVKWALYNNKEEPLTTLNEVIYSYKLGYRRPIPAADSASIRSGKDRNVGSYISKLALQEKLARVTSRSSRSTVTRKEIKDDLSEAKFLVGYQGDLDFDGDSDDDDDDEIITFREMYILRKRRQHRSERPKDQEEEHQQPQQQQQQQQQHSTMDRVNVVIYKRAPILFSAFYDPEKSADVLHDPEYYRTLHLRFGTLVEPIFEDLESESSERAI